MPGKEAPVMDELFTVNALLALATLTVLEIVLGIDNIVFLAILTGKLPEQQQPKARTLGLTLAAAGRVALLLAISWVITLDKTVIFELPWPPPETHAAAPPATTTPISLKDLVLLLGGVFLLAKATWEIGRELEHAHGAKPHKQLTALAAVLAQIVVIDLVFSLDSVLTAVGMVNPDEYQTRWVPLSIMVTAVLAAIAVMLAFSSPISRFVNQHPSVKMLALAFLLLIGVVLVAEGLHTHIPRSYIYVSMGFSLLVEMLNLRASRRPDQQVA
jgi:predicted tellurium resistance membrane protein TerC